MGNAVQESAIGLYKTELIEHDRITAWGGAAEVEAETASWVHWYNTTRAHLSIAATSPELVGFGWRGGRRRKSPCDRADSG